jgi:ArsR family transcriptional regulator, lead/cadmium/zinc/bismuth-responsive transcriptional repressor
MVDKCCKKGTKAQNNIKNLKKDLEVLGDENRLRILCLIKVHKELCVCDIYEALDLPQNLVSYHLGKLKDAGFLDSRKAGVSVFYHQGEKRLKDFQELINLIV